MAATGVLVNIAPTMPEVPRVSLHVTESAREQFLRLRANDHEEGKALRLSVQGGGCSGFLYEMTFDQPTERDQVIDAGGGLQVVIDPVSAPVLDGVEVDFVLSLESSGFKIRNPNAKNVCSCGKSFS